MVRVLSVVVGALALVGCDAGLEPRPAGIRGTVTFRGAIPESTDVVYVVAYRTFPRSTADLFTFQPQPTPPTLQLGGSTTAYALGVPPGQYEWVLAVWKKVGTLTSANADSLLMEAGFYRDSADTSRPGVVTVQGTADSVDFVVDFGNRHPISYWFPALRQ